LEARGWVEELLNPASSETPPHLPIAVDYFNACPRALRFALRRRRREGRATPGALSHPHACCGISPARRPGPGPVAARVEIASGTDTQIVKRQFPPEATIEAFIAALI